MLETGPRGGLFYINGNGNRTYVPRDTPNQHSGFSTGTYVSSGPAKGRTVYQGGRPRGGSYTINSSGNKSYMVETNGEIDSYYSLANRINIQSISFANKLKESSTLKHPKETRYIRNRCIENFINFFKNN